MSGDIVIKRIKKMGHSHHGGAWKVAYADFVTAMMAFFLMLWLLSTSSEEVLKGLAEYFTPTVGLRDGVGIGVHGGLAEDDEGTNRGKKSMRSIVYGAPSKGPIVKSPEDTMMNEEASEQIKLVHSEVSAMLDAADSIKEFSENIDVKETAEGLVIEIASSKKNPMFARPYSSALANAAERILAQIVGIVGGLPNFISVAGHTGSVNEGQVDYWSLSIMRANIVRRYMEAQGLDAEQIVRIVGFADRELKNPDDAGEIGNHRLEIILLRQSQQSTNRQIAPEAMLDSDVSTEDSEAYLEVAPQLLPVQESSPKLQGVGSPMTNKGTPKMKKDLFAPMD